VQNPTNKIVAPFKNSCIAQIVAGDESACKVTEVIGRTFKTQNVKGIPESVPAERQEACTPGFDGLFGQLG
jgi:hypothetical protein